MVYISIIGLTIIALHYILTYDNFCLQNQRDSLIEDHTNTVCGCCHETSHRNSDKLSFLCSEILWIPEYVWFRRIMWRNWVTCHLRTLSPQSGWQAARVLPGREKSIDIWKDSETVSQQREQANFRAQDLQRCNTVGGKQVLKKQYMDLLRWYLPQTYLFMKESKQLLEIARFSSFSTVNTHTQNTT